LETLYFINFLKTIVRLV